jgi:hypothetical protein
MGLYLQSDHASVGLKACRSFRGLFVKTPSDKEMKISRGDVFRMKPMCQRRIAYDALSATCRDCSLIYCERKTLLNDWQI